MPASIKSLRADCSCTSLSTITSASRQLHDAQQIHFISCAIRSSFTFLCEYLGAMPLAYLRRYLLYNCLCKFRAFCESRSGSVIITLPPWFAVRRACKTDWFWWRRRGFVSENYKLHCVGNRHFKKHFQNKVNNLLKFLLNSQTS